MLATVLTAMYLVLRAAEQVRGRQVKYVLPYVVSQPMPWRVHYVSQSRRSSRTDEVSTCPRVAVSVLLTSENKAAATIQTQFRRYQRKKNSQK
uniref:Secreted protein n=1 Tax=Paramormyrops kingsleyae TaxID=1676925 RepID=A0A3B3QSV3_9TELE